MEDLRNAAPPGHELATLLTQVLVEAGDPAFAKPTMAATGKPAAIGRLEDAVRIVEGMAGTTIEASVAKLTVRP